PCLFLQSTRATSSDAPLLHDALPICQCGGRSRPTRTPGAASASSCSRFVALVTQLVSTVPVSSTRSESGPYHVNTGPAGPSVQIDRKSTRLNSSHVSISYAVFCLKKK